MKLFSTVLISLFILVILGLGGGFLWFRSNASAVSEVDESQRFIIPKGRSAEQVGNSLEDKGLIKSSLAFKIYVQVFDRQASINAGEFNLSASMSLKEVVEALGKGPAELWVTVPEGLRREETVERFINGLELNNANAVLFRENFLDLTVNQEGYLFPDTYLLPHDTSAKKVVDLMTNTFEIRVDDEIRAEMAKRGLTMTKVVTLASILEKETRTDSERPVVAGIYFNRLAIGQALYADATAQYANGSIRCANTIGECDWWKVPTRADVRIDSPYNTYKYSGVPPGPIVSPGLSSLRAVIYSEDTPYFYYVHDADGQIRYAVSLDEHNANVSKYLR